MLQNTFLQNPLSFKHFSILEENCGVDINNGTIKSAGFLLRNGAKNFLWVRYTFLQNPLLLKRFCISEENCGTDIDHETIQCKFFVDKCYKRQSSGESYFPTKIKYFQVSQHFRRKLWCRHH